jgi:glycosyltransferase involved in cell wall biosynthesis
MRVVHIIKVVRVAGAEQHLLTLLAGLRDRGVDAQLLLLTEPDKAMDNYVRVLTERSIPVQRWTIYRHADVGLYRRLIGALRPLKPEVVHTHLLHADLFGIPAARLARVPVAVTSRHNDNIFRHRFPIKQINRTLWRWADAGVAISDALRQFSITVEGAPPERVCRIYYGLEAGPPLERKIARAALLNELSLSPDTVLIGVVCRLIEQKGVAYGLRAFAQVAARFPAAHLVIAGDGPLRARLETETRSRGLAGRVHFLGWRSDVTPTLAGLDMMLMPSLWEGFGLVLLEAMAQQVPIIASAVSAIPEVVVDGETGLLVPPRDVDALAAALTRLLADRPLRQHMGLMGRDRLETHFGAARMVDETLALYERLLRQ